MLTYELKKAPGAPLYEGLYRCIREDILSGKLQPGDKLPSKRALCANLKVSKITVEGAYNQLLAEGLIRSEQKVGYFVEPVSPRHRSAPAYSPPQKPETAPVDLTAAGPERFPFSVWSRLTRQVMLDLGEELLQSLPHQGIWELRSAIADHLAQFRGLQADPEQIIIGAGSDFLYNLLVQLLGRELVYALEEPGYRKIRRVYEAAGAQCVSAEMDGQGVLPRSLDRAQVLHLSPSHHFPTGLVTPMSRRQALLEWAAGDKWIIEDDYDSEFRFAARPLPTMKAMEGGHRVIYMNTFSRSLAPSIRISYMVLPPELMEQMREKLGFYSCTVPSFEQHVLARFLKQGYFEKHINRMRKLYKARRNRILELLAACPQADRLTIREENAGLHFLVKVDTVMTDRQLVEHCRQLGIRVQSLQEYYWGPVPEAEEKTLIINYAGLSDRELEQLERIVTYEM